MEILCPHLPTVKTARSTACGMIHQFPQLTIVTETDGCPCQAIGDVYLGDADVITYHGFRGLVRGVYRLNADGSLEQMERPKE